MFGLATLFYPPLKLIVASVTTSVAMVLGGLALMVLPSLIVGNELLILGGVGLAVGAWFLAHRHGQLRGAVEASGKITDGVERSKGAYGENGELSCWLGWPVLATLLAGVAESCTKLPPVE